MPTGATMGDEFITLARVLKTQGRHGEVAVETHSDVPDRFVEGMRLFALDQAACGGSCGLRNCGRIRATWF